MKVLSGLLTTAIIAKATALTQEEKLRLLRKAVPFNGRKLQNNNNGGAYITASDSIQFNSCVSLTAMPEREDQEFIGSSDDMKALFENGDIVSQKSVVLFSICQTDECSYESEDNLYVTDLDAYLQLTAYQPQKTFDYCEACQQSQQWCLYDQYDQQAEGDGENADAENADADAAAEGDAEAADGGRRRNRKLQNVQYVSCDKCENLGCFVDEQQQENNGGNNGLTLEGMLEWVKQQTECVETGQYWNNLPLYSSFMCNEAGTGVEIALFLDDNCGLYTSKVSYASLYPDDQYVSKSQSVVTYPFNYDIDCAAEIEWASPEEEQNQDANAEDANAEGQDNYDANDFCMQLLNEGSILPLADCGGGNGNNQNQNQNQDDADEYYQYFSGFTYNLMGKEDAENPYAVCSAVQAMQGEYSSFKKTNQKYNVYKQDSEHSGQNYQYKKASGSKSGLSGGAIAGIVIAVLVACAAGFVAVKYYKKKKDSKREPLVTSEGIGA